MVLPTVSGNTSGETADNSGKTILFAEDEGPVRSFVSALLLRSGYELIVASDGKEALEKARQHVGPIHLLLSDVEMPRMTGIELAIQLNQERAETKVLLISGLTTGMLVLNNGWHFLPKPFVGDMLRDRIRECLSEQPPVAKHVVVGGP